MPSANDALIPDLDSTPGTTPPTNQGLHPSTTATSGKKKKKNKKNAAGNNSSNNGSKPKPWDDTSAEDTAYPKSVTPSPPVDHFSGLRVGTEPTPPNSEPEPEFGGVRDDEDQAMAAAWEETPPQPPVELDLEPEPEVNITEPELLVEDYGEVATGQYTLQQQQQQQPEERPPSPKPPPASAASHARHAVQPPPVQQAPAVKKAARSRGLDRDYESSLSRPTSVAERRRGDSTTQPTSPTPRKSFVEPANPPHMTQNHYFAVPGFDFGRGAGATAAAKAEKGAKQAGSEHYCCCFDSFSNAGDAVSATKAKDALIVGWEGGLEVYRVLKDKMEIVGRLEGLRGGVVGAKIVPWCATGGDAARPVVALVVHGPMAAGDQQVDELGENAGHYQTTVEVFSLHNQRHLATLYRSLPVALPEAKLGQFATVPEPVGDLRLDARGRYLTVSSGKSGEIFVFAQGQQHQHESSGAGGFRCIGKYWTSLQSRFDVQARPNGSGENLPGNEAPEPQTSPLLSLSGRWLAFVPPSSSSKISVQGTLALSEGNQQPPGVGAHLTPPQPSVTCDIVGLNSEGVLAKFSRQAAQEILKASRRGIEMGMAGWREFTQPSPPSRNSQRAENGEEMFPPTNAPDEGLKRVAKEPAVVAIVDLERLLDAEENHAKHLPPPLASFALEDGCNFLSLSADGLRLLTTSRKGESSNIWDLRHAAHGSYHKRDVDDGDAVVGPHVTRIQSIVRSTQSVVLDAAWARDDNFVALLTAHGTVHLHEVSARPQESQKRRRKSTITAPLAEKADATVSLSTGLSPPSSNGFLGGIRSGWQTVSTQVNAMRSNATPSETRGTFGGIPTTFAGFREVTNAGAAAGGRAIARGLSQGYSVARTGAADVWHADDNKIKHKEPLNNVPLRSVRWLRSRSGMSVAVACGGKVHLYPVQRVSRPRGESTFSGLKAEWKSRREFGLPPIATAVAATAQSGRANTNSCAQQGPHGFWSLRSPAALQNRPNGHLPLPLQAQSQAAAESDKALYETNPPYCPLYIDRRVSMMAYNETSPHATSHNSSSSAHEDFHSFALLGHAIHDPEPPWLFGQKLPSAGKLNERSGVSEASLSDDEDEDAYARGLAGGRANSTFEADLAAGTVDDGEEGFDGNGGDAGVQSRIMINPVSQEIRIGSSRTMKKGRKGVGGAAVGKKKVTGSAGGRRTHEREEFEVLEGEDEEGIF